MMTVFTVFEDSCGKGASITVAILRIGAGAWQSPILVSAATLRLMEWITTKQHLLDSLAKANPQLETFLDSLSPHQWSHPRDAAGWAVKDHVAHLAVWQDGITALLRYQPRWPAMGLSSEFVDSNAIDTINDVIFQQHRDKSPHEVQTMFDESQTRFLAVLSELSDDDLHRTYSHYQPFDTNTDSGAPILNWVVGNTSEHVMEHLPWMRAIVAPSPAANA
jgi:hypothetical protein